MAMTPEQMKERLDSIKQAKADEQAALVAVDAANRSAAQANMAWGKARERLETIINTPEEQ